MVRRTVALLASVLVVSAANSVEETCDGYECDATDMSLAQLRLRMHSKKTNASVTTNQTSSVWAWRHGPPRNADCFAISVGQCGGNGPNNNGNNGAPGGYGGNNRGQRNGGNGGCSRNNQGCWEGHCACQNGCAGDNGQCFEQGNNLLLRRFELRSATRSNRRMYMKKLTTNNQINTVSSTWGWSKWGATEFRLYELPPGQQWGGRRRFLLVSEQWPDWAVTTWPVEGKYQPFMFIAREMSQAKSLAELAVVVCDMGSRGFPGQIVIGGTDDGRTIAGNNNGVWTVQNMLGGNNGHVMNNGGNMGGTVWANMAAPSKYVYGMQGDPGNAGRWIVNADLPQGMLPPC